VNTVSNRKGSAVITTPSDTEIVITRVFDAPAALIWKAWSTPELVQRWYGFESSQWKVCEIDLRVGGTWRYVTVDDDFEVGFHGEYLEIDEPRRLVSTEVYEGMADAETVNTMTLEEVDGVTTMTTLISHTTKEMRDGQLASGMETGMQVSYDRLEDVARSLA
jgi:uncharacterized protein YndB with AHSA1/START domain